MSKNNWFSATASRASRDEPDVASWCVWLVARLFGKRLLPVEIVYDPFVYRCLTSADRLNAGWTVAQRACARGIEKAHSHIEHLMSNLPPHCKLVTVIDGHPATLSWLGSMSGHQNIPLGVERFGQTGTIGDLYRHHGIDHSKGCGPNIGGTVESVNTLRRSYI